MNARIINNTLIAIALIAALALEELKRLMFADPNKFRQRALDRYNAGCGFAVPMGPDMPIATLDAAAPAPIKMILQCPLCQLQHVDAPEPENGWTNPPHKSHKCHGCGFIWRPADVPTEGVATIQTKGSADSDRTAFSNPIQRPDFKPGCTEFGEPSTAGHEQVMFCPNCEEQHFDPEMQFFVMHKCARCGQGFKPIDDPTRGISDEIAVNSTLQTDKEFSLCPGAEFCSHRHKNNCRFISNCSMLSVNNLSSTEDL